MERVVLTATGMELQPEDIIVSRTMIEVGLAILEETDDRPLSRSTVERAFQQMCHCALQEASLARTDLK
ncbi:hypothetical protein A9L43_15260 [Pseudomonas mosselii]|nr:hypothetical protein A9L43_15260 [Pseudomonas mosselii]